MQVPDSNTPVLDSVILKRRPSKPRIKLKSWLSFTRIIHRQLFIIWMVYLLHLEIIHLLMQL